MVVTRHEASGMREWLVAITENAVLIVDAIALVALMRTLEAYAGLLRVQRLADVIDASINSDRETAARIAAATVTATSCNHFLERGVTDVDEWGVEATPEQNAAVR